MIQTADTVMRPIMTPIMRSRCIDQKLPV